MGAKGGGSRVGTARTRVWARGRFCEMDRWLAGAVAVATIPRRRERAWTRTGDGGRQGQDTEGGEGKWPKHTLTGVYLYGITG